MNMITPLQCIDYICLRGEAQELSYRILGEDTDTLIHKRENGEVVIAFCGSNSKVDWKNNFHFWKKAYKDAEIPFNAHSGFLKCWKLIRHEVEEQVKALNPVSITVTGHSYGGAIAVLCAEDMGYCFPDVKIQMVTFGAPRVIGWKNWKKIKERWDNARQFRCGADFVTCVPPLGMFFHHVVKRTHIGDRPSIMGWFKSGKYHDLDEYTHQIIKISRSE
jgi:predicted lipase